MTTKNYTAFVSHSWDYDKQLKNLKSLIEKNSTITIDYSEVTVDNRINSEQRDYIRGVLKKELFLPMFFWLWLECIRHTVIG